MTLPKFTAGMTLDQISAAAMNELVELVRWSRAIGVGPGLELDRSSGRPTIRLAAAPASAVRDEMTVLLVAEPAAGDESMRVRPVRYADMPPRPDRPHCDDGLEPACRYEWAGEALSAWPDFGARPEDYGQYVWTEPVPKLEAAYLRARYDQGVWIVELPSATTAVRHVVVRSIPAPTANWLDVQDVRPARVGGEWDGSFAASGAVWQALVHPYSLAGDFAGLLWPIERPLDPAATILRAYRESSAWWLSQYVRFELPALDRSLVFSDCVPWLAAPD